MSQFCYLALLALLCTGSAHAGDYYVDLDAGSDAASGTSVAPWRTLTHAMATVAPSAGHRVLVRGTANLSSPGEAFPIRVPAGISLEAWDAQHGAVLDAELLPCLEIVGPAHRGQSLRGYAGNLRLIGTPALSVEVVGITESVDLVVEGCELWGELRMILAEAAGQTRTGSCALTVSHCSLSDVLVDRRTSSISTTHDVLSVALVDNTGGFQLLLRGLSAATRPLELLRNRGFFRIDVERCSAATAVIEDNDCATLSAELSASTVLCRRNYADFGSMSFAAQGRLEVLENRVLVGALVVSGDGTEKIHDNIVSDGILFFDAVGGLRAPCSVLRNRAFGLQVDAVGVHALSIAENRLLMGLVLERLPHAPVDVLRNSIDPQFPDHGIWLRGALVGHLPGAPLVTIADNRIQSPPMYGAGVLVDSTLGQLVLERNEITCEAGIAIVDSAIVRSSSGGRSFRIERNAISGYDTGVELGLAGALEDLRFLNNVIHGGSRGVVVRRGSYAGTVRFWNNIVSASFSSAVSGAFSPSDLVTNNLCSDGSLLALHRTNIVGDPQFETYPQRLRPSSPGVGSGLDPLTGAPGFNLGLDPLQPPATLHYREQSETNATLRLDAPGASSAVLLFGVAVSDPATPALCDGLAGVDLASGFFPVPLPVSNGALSLPLTLPPGPWTVAVQALSDLASAVPPCRASNTVVVRR